MESTPATNRFHVKFAPAIQCGTESVNACVYEWAPQFQSGAIVGDWMWGENAQKTEQTKDICYTFHGRILYSLVFWTLSRENIWWIKTGELRNGEKIFVKHKYITNPPKIPSDAIVQAAKDLTQALKVQLPALAEELGETTASTLKRLNDIFNVTAKKPKKYSQLRQPKG